MVWKITSFAGLAAAVVIAGIAFLPSVTGNVSSTTAEGGLTPRLYLELTERIELLEAEVLKLHNRELETSEAGSSVAEAAQDDGDQFTSMAESLVALAESATAVQSMAASLEKVVERLAAIEEELAWFRIDYQERTEQ